MASGGSGDVLTGLVAARLAQGDDPAFAAQLAVHLHGLAGDLAVAAGVAPAVPAGTLAEYLPQAYAKLGQGMRVWHTASVAETRALSAPSWRGSSCRAGCLLLYGDLGAGKTVLAQGVAEGLGIDPREVQSPTFALLREHELPGGRGGPAGSHLDLYRLSPSRGGGLRLRGGPPRAGSEDRGMGGAPAVRSSPARWP